MTLKYALKPCRSVTGHTLLLRRLHHVLLHDVPDGRTREGGGGATGGGHGVQQDVIVGVRQ